MLSWPEGFRIHRNRCGRDCLRSRHEAPMICRTSRPVRKFGIGSGRTSAVWAAHPRVGGLFARSCGAWSRKSSGIEESSTRCSGSRTWAPRRAPGSAARWPIEAGVPDPDADVADPRTHPSTSVPPPTVDSLTEGGPVVECTKCGFESQLRISPPSVQPPADPSSCAFNPGGRINDPSRELRLT